VSVVSRRLGIPRRVTVRANASGVPLSLDGVRVEALREEWVVEDRWWSGRPLRRRYFELVLADGRDEVVFLELTSGRWFAQRG
jgi:hypothetical protein